MSTKIVVVDIRRTKSPESAQKSMAFVVAFVPLFVNSVFSTLPWLYYNGELNSKTLELTP